MARRGKEGTLITCIHNHRHLLNPNPQFLGWPPAPSTRLFANSQFNSSTREVSPTAFALAAAPLFLTRSDTRPILTNPRHRSPYSATCAERAVVAPTGFASAALPFYPFDSSRCLSYTPVTLCCVAAPIFSRLIVSCSVHVQHYPNPLFCCFLGSGSALWSTVGVPPLLRAMYMVYSVYVCVCLPVYQSFLVIRQERSKSLLWANQLLNLGKLVVVVQALRIGQSATRLDDVARHNLLDRQLNLLHIDRCLL